MSKTPSIAVIPSGYKGAVSGAKGTVYSVLPTNGDADLDFTRNCTATRVNQNGLLEEVGLNVPRLDYSDGGCPSLLLEPNRTNLVFESNDFLNYPKIGSDITLVGGVASPYGDNNAYRYSIDVDGSFLYDAGNYDSPTLGSIVTRSIFVKNVNADNFQLFVRASETVGQVTFNFNGGTIVSANLTEGISYKYTEVSNGWYRLELTYEESSSATQYLRLITNVGGEVQIFGNQLEEGSYATSYIPTDGAAVTRFKDEASKDNLESYINSSEGVLYAEMSALNDDLSFREISISDNSTSNAIRVYYSSSSNGISYQVRSNGSLELLVTYISNDITDFNKIAVKWKINDFSMWVNGVNVFSESLGETPISMNTITFSPSISSNADFEGKIKDLRVYNEALTDAELITLTQ
jgi:hypothetical protein